MAGRRGTRGPQGARGLARASLPVSSQPTGRLSPHRRPERSGAGRERSGPATASRPRGYYSTRAADAIGTVPCLSLTRRAVSGCAVDAKPVLGSELRSPLSSARGCQKRTPSRGARPRAPGGPACGARSTSVPPARSTRSRSRDALEVREQVPPEDGVRGERCGCATCGVRSAVRAPVAASRCAERNCRPQRRPERDLIVGPAPVRVGTFLPREGRPGKPNETSATRRCGPGPC